MTDHIVVLVIKSLKLCVLNDLDGIPAPIYQVIMGLDYAVMPVKQISTFTSSGQVICRIKPNEPENPEVEFKLNIEDVTSIIIERIKEEAE